MRSLLLVAALLVSQGVEWNTLPTYPGIYWSYLDPGKSCWAYSFNIDGKRSQDIPVDCNVSVGTSNGSKYNDALRSADKAAKKTLEACFRADGDRLWCFEIRRGGGGV